MRLSGICVVFNPVNFTLSNVTVQSIRRRGTVVGVIGEPGDVAGLGLCLLYEGSVC